MDNDYNNQYKEKENNQKMYKLLNRLKNKFYFCILSFVSIILMKFISYIEIIPEYYKGIIYLLICFCNCYMFFMIHFIRD